MKVAAFHASRCLSEADLGPERVGCLWCGSADVRPVVPVQAEPEVTLRRCRSCAAASVSNLPTPEALDHYYGSYYRGDADHAVTMDDPTRLAARIAGYAPPERHLRVLDLGGGDGTISAEVLRVRRAAGEVTVVDYDHRRTALAPPGVTIAHLTDLADLPGDAVFDLVLASAVLEHLPEPAPVLTGLLQRVAPGGTIYARAPYVEPFLAVARRLGMTINFTFPAHLSDLGPAFWDGLGAWVPEVRRFEVLASRPSPVETSLRQRPARTLVAAAAKAPWHLVKGWPFVGGWEWAARAIR
ncbi:MAG: class I SAM-dependent methyltransferase [Acidimicrobiia bacterium]|nr:class I SAM-dependent methyltransferase [Acidimicrobiia bacterium]